MIAMERLIYEKNVVCGMGREMSIKYSQLWVTVIIVTYSTHSLTLR